METITHCKEMVEMAEGYIKAITISLTKAKGGSMVEGGYLKEKLDHLMNCIDYISLNEQEQADKN